MSSKADERHEANLGILDSILGLASGIRSENRRLSFRLEEAVKNTENGILIDNAAPTSSVWTEEEEVQLLENDIGEGDIEEDFLEATSSIEVSKRAGIKRQAKTKQPNPFDFRRKPSQEMDAKLDEILKRLSNVSTNCLLYTSPSPRD